MGLLPLIGAVVAFIGAVFLLLASVGIVRMPDVYNRIQAGTKASTVGVVLTLVGLGLHEPDWLLKIVLIAVFVLLTNPLSSHALARAAHAAGVPLAPGAVRDELAESRSAKAPIAVEEEPAS
jgi:multicomponent Na+:H+ antiporter subunit G